LGLPVYRRRGRGTDLFFSSDRGPRRGIERRFLRTMIPVPITFQNTLLLIVFILNGASTTAIALLSGLFRTGRARKRTYQQDHESRRRSAETQKIIIY
jgi:hypothetical protein